MAALTKETLAAAIAALTRPVGDPLDMTAIYLLVDPFTAEYMLADRRKARRMWRKRMSNRELLVEVILQEDVRNYRAGTTLWAHLRPGRKARPGTYWEAVDPADGSTFRLSRSQAKKACPGQPGAKEVR